jgi:hypothetical protein
MARAVDDNEQNDAIDLRAIYEFLRAIPSQPNNTHPGP